MSGAGTAGVLVDSCVLLDVITADPHWQQWSTEQLQLCLQAGPVAINPLIYGEVAFAYEQIEVVDAVLPRHLIRLLADSQGGRLSGRPRPCRLSSQGGQEGSDPAGFPDRCPCRDRPLPAAQP